MKDTKGFTLIEIMIAMAIFAIVVTGIYETYHYQQKSYMKQEQAVNMQQNLRAGLYFLKRDIRMAGYDPAEDADPTITIANIAELEFEVDQDGSGTINDSSRETIRYALTDDGSNNRDDSTRDGIANSFPCNLGREYNLGGGLQPVAENVDALEFCYVLKVDNETIEATVLSGSYDDPDDIRSIIVSMLVRTENPIKGGHTDDRTYRQASSDTTLTPNFNGTRPAPWGPFNDSYQRRLLITKVRCRNMGMDPFAD